MNKFLNRIQLFSILILSLWVIACTADPQKLHEPVKVEIIDQVEALIRLNMPVEGSNQ